MRMAAVIWKFGPVALVEARLSVVGGALAGIKALRKIQAAAVLRR